MSKTSKIITGILSFLPLLLFIGYFVLFFSFFLNLFMNINTQGKEMENPGMFFAQFAMMFGLIGLMMLLTFGLLIYFIVHIAGNKKLDSNERLVWILIIIFAGMFGFPIYWYLKIWQDEETPAA